MKKMDKGIYALCAVFFGVAILLSAVFPPHHMMGVYFLNSQNVGFLFLGLAEILVALLSRKHMKEGRNVEFNQFLMVAGFMFGILALFVASGKIIYHLIFH